MTARQVQLITDFRPEIIMVTPSYMLTLLDEFERQGVDPRATSLRVGVFGAEPWTQEMRREIEERFAIDAVDIYGLSEVMGPGVAQECVETKDGLHIWEDHFYPEVVDPFTGEVLPEGEEGELVFTSLTKEAMPVIRYRTRDLTRLLPGTARVFRRMEKVTGRSDDMVILRGVNLFPTQIEEIVLRTAGVAPHFQLRLTREGRMDALTVRAEARAGATPDQRTAAARSIAAAVKDGIGVSVAVEVVDPETLERSVGKIKRIVDLRTTPARPAAENEPATAGTPPRCSGRSPREPVPQLALEDLAARVARQLRHEQDLLRRLEVGELLPCVVQEFVLRDLTPRHDHRGDRLDPAVVRQTDHRGLGDARMCTARPRPGVRRPAHRRS